MAGRDWRLLYVLAVVVAALVAGAVMIGVPRRDGPAVTAEAVDTSRAAARQPTLYCEFYNFVGRTPKVGFSFAIVREAASLAFEQVFQTEIDGARTDFGTADNPCLEWAFDGSEDPPTLRSQDGAIQINLYGYKPVPGVTWSEAGLRSVPYLNLDGTCRRSAA